MNVQVVIRSDDGVERNELVSADGSDHARSAPAVRALPRQRSRLAAARRDRGRAERDPRRGRVDQRDDGGRPAPASPVARRALRHARRARQFTVFFMPQGGARPRPNVPAPPPPPGAAEAGRRPPARVHGLRTQPPARKQGAVQGLVTTGERSAPALTPQELSASIEARKKDVNLRRKIHKLLLEHLDLATIDAQKLDDPSMRPKVLNALRRIVEQVSTGDSARRSTVDALIGELADEALGLGPLERFLADPSINEIMVVDPNTIYVEQRGKLCFQRGALHRRRARARRHRADRDAARPPHRRVVAPRRRAPQGRLARERGHPAARAARARASRSASSRRTR